MRALVTSPSSEERIELRDVAEPSPSANQALVRVKAVSLNRGEVNRLASAEDGVRLGWDIAGDVEQPSADGQSLEAGTRVVGFVREAGWSELVAVSSLHLAPIPDSVTYSAASTVPVAGLTALRMLRVGGLLLGKRVLITGASGGVGRFAVQLAASAGAYVTGVSRNRERAEGLDRIGADAIVEDVAHASGLFDLILESVGGESLAAAIGLIAPGGTLVTFGNSSRQPTTIDISSFYGKSGSRIEGFSLLAPSQPPDFRPDLAFLAGEVAAARLDPQVDFETSWREAASALKALRERRVQGKAVLLID